MSEKDEELDNKVYTAEGADATFVKKTEFKRMYKDINLANMVVTPEEFEMHTGINLVFRLVNENMVDGDSYASAQIFIKKIQRRLNNYIDTHFNGGIGATYAKASDAQMYHYKLAVIEQVLYIFNNTSITESMGLNDDGYKALSRWDIKQREIGIECQRELEMAGLWNRNLNGYRGFYNYWWRF